MGGGLPRQRPVRRQTPLGKTGKGNNWLRATLTESANAAARTKNTYLAAQYQRLRGRRGHNKAIAAVGHSILTATWHMLQTGELYRDLGGDYFTRQNPTASPNASSDNSKRSDTTSRSSPRRPPPDPDFVTG